LYAHLFVRFVAYASACDLAANIETRPVRLVCS